jgi:hypothetical protein
MLGGYTFPWKPDKFGIPHPDLYKSLVRTWNTAVYFSWGTGIIGKNIELSWIWMSEDQWDELDAMYRANTPVTWDPEVLGVGPYDVEIIGLEGELFDVADYQQPYRRDVKVRLVILSAPEGVMS